MTRLFDTHAHYTDEKLDADISLPASLLSGELEGIVCVASDLEDSVSCIKKASLFDGMYASAGIHPHTCGKYPDIGEAMERLRGLLSSPKVVALGEAGLDYHYDADYKELQKEFFKAQAELARDTGLPLIVHDREAHADVFDILSHINGLRGIIHSCSESAETVKEYIKLGFYISFSGVITFKNASRTLDALRAVPPDRLLLETDCPYMTPVPFRGSVNHSGYLRYTAEKAAEVLGYGYDELCRITSENARRIYNIN